MSLISASEPCVEVQADRAFLTLSRATEDIWTRQSESWKTRASKKIQTLASEISLIAR